MFDLKKLIAIEQKSVELVATFGSDKVTAVATAVVPMANLMLEFISEMRSLFHHANSSIAPVAAPVPVAGTAATPAPLQVVLANAAITQTELRENGGTNV